MILAPNGKVIASLAMVHRRPQVDNRPGFIQTEANQNGLPARTSLSTAQSNHWGPEGDATDCTADTHKPKRLVGGSADGALSAVDQAWTRHDGVAG